MFVMVVELFVFWPAEALSITKPPNIVTAINAKARLSFLIIVSSFKTVLDFQGERKAIYSEVDDKSIIKQKAESTALSDSALQNFSIRVELHADPFAALPG